MSMCCVIEEGNSQDLIRLGLSLESEYEPGVLTPAYKPRTLGCQVLGHSGLQSKTLSQKKK